MARALTTRAKRIAAAAHAAVVEQVDWPCRVYQEYAPANLGLKRRVESGLDWVFERVEEAVILEDDCLPDPTFFSFCAALLAHYRSDPQIMAISGTNFIHPRYACPHSYVFSRYPLIWGWATWRRAWRLYDPHMARWPQARASGWLDHTLADHQACQYWAYQFETAYTRGHTWDYGWTFACWQQHGLSIMPAANLVSNIGFGVGATHTGDEKNALAHVPAAAMVFPLHHPPAVVRDSQADRLTEALLFSGNLARLFARLHVRSQNNPGHNAPEAGQR